MKRSLRKFLRMGGIFKCYVCGWWLYTPVCGYGRIAFLGDNGDYIEPPIEGHPLCILNTDLHNPSLGRNVVR